MAQRSAWRTSTAAGVTVLAVGGTAALWMYLKQRKQRRRAGAPAGLAEDVRDALLQDSLEGKLDEQLTEDFGRAVTWVGGASGLSTNAMLKLYGCYKQVTVGDAPKEKARGGMEASMKWEAWAELRGTPRALAVRAYVEALDEAAPEWRSGAPPAEEGRRGPSEGMMGLSVSTMGKIGDPDKEGDVDETPIGQLCEKIAESDVDEVRAILQRQPEMAFQSDKDGMTPLHWAADRGEVEVARILVEMAGKGGAAASRLNAQDESLDTPLHYAVLTENVEIVQMLLAAGADPELANEEGETPLALAKDAGLEEHFDA